MPCLGLLSLPYDQLAVSGCELVEYPSSPNQPIRVKNCVGDTVESFRLVDSNSSSQVIACPLVRWEVVPPNVRRDMISPDMTVAEFVEAFVDIDTVIIEFNDEVEVTIPFFFNFKIRLPISFESDISAVLDSVGTQLLTDTINTIFAFWLPDDFSDDRPASEATLNGLMRILMAFVFFRMFGAKTVSTTTQMLASSALYRTLTNEAVPKIDSRPETLSQFALVSLTVIAFGLTWGKVLREFRFGLLTD